MRMLWRASEQETDQAVGLSRAFAQLMVERRVSSLVGFYALLGALVEGWIEEGLEEDDLHDWMSQMFVWFPTVMGKVKTN